MTKNADFNALMVSQIAAPADPQMQLPFRPKLVAGVQPVWHSRECLIMVGAAQTVTLRGKAVSAVLPGLLPLLDGTRTLAQLQAQAHGVGPKALEQTLMLLFMRGLLAGEPAAAADPLYPELERDPRWHRTLCAYERYLDVTRTCRSAAAALAAMRRARLLLIGDSDYAIAVLAALKGLGLGAATLLTPRETLAQQARALADADCDVRALVQDLAATALDTDAFTIAAFVAGKAGVPQAMAWADRLRGASLLYAVLGTHELRIGPCVQASASACLHCAQAGGVFDENDGGDYGPLELELGAERVAHKLLQLITRLMAIDSVERSETLDSATLLFKARPVLRQFGCAHCAPLTASWSGREGLELGGAHLAPLAWFYHRHSQHAEYLMAPKGHQAHYASKNRQASAGAYKRYRSRPRTPQAELSARSPGFARLSQLLHLAVGRRTVPVGAGLHLALRFTPSGGSMSSQNVYVLSYEDETCGVHYFDPNGYWQCLSTDLPALDALGLAAPTDRPTRFALLLTCSHARLESKYGNTAYRYAFYDAGALIASLQALAPHQRFACQAHADFDDDATTALHGSLPTNEFATAFVLLTDAPESTSITFAK
jgi:hypothetical protein